MNKVLFFQTAFLGDLLLSIPCLKRLRRIYPDKAIHLYCRKPFGDLFLKLGLVDHIVEVDKSKSESYQEAFRELKKQDYQIVITPHPSLRSAWMSFRLRAQHSYGFSSWWNHLFYKKTVRKNASYPDALKQLQLIAALDPELRQWMGNLGEHWSNSTQKVSFSDLGENKIPDWASLDISSDIIQWGLQNSLQAPEYILLAPGSVWPTKRWPQEKFIELGRSSSKFHKIGVIGSPAEFELCAEVAQGIPGAENLAGQSLLHSLFIMSQSRLLVAGDSGSIHMAASVGLPVVSIFGPTVPAQGFRPWVQPMTIIQQQLNCRPCGRHGGVQCPLGTHECMKSISADQVARAMTDLLEE